MVSVLPLNWWVLAIRGIVGILFGLIAFALPGVTLAALTLLFGAYALVDGIVSFIAAFRAGKLHRTWWPFLLEGIAGVLAAVATVLWPGLTLLVLLYMIAAWAIVTGVFEFVAAIRLRRLIRNEWLLALAGVASILFGFVLFAAPAAGAIVLTLWVGAYAFIFGVLMLALSFRLRKWSGIPHPQTS
jgi:uncharacterized membrane protein HdeD (DUF308 family)